MSSIQKRTKIVRTEILQEWKERWWKFIIDNKDQDMCWSYISEHPNLTMKDINDNPDKPWDWKEMSGNTMKYINEMPDKHWNWYYISENPNITMKFINDNPDKPWDWSWVSRNPNITMEDIFDNPEQPWDWTYISMKRSLTMKDILDHPEKPWSWYYISCNKFTKEKEEFQMKRYREHLAAILIQNAYKNALVNPNCKLGLNKIERDMVFAGI